MCKCGAVLEQLETLFMQIGGNLRRWLVIARMTDASK